MATAAQKRQRRMNRRNFLGLAAGGTFAATAGTPSISQAR
ncbi:twin-arginine translocation signal domain-containing protein [Rhizobium phaseoli]|uniref:Twin-arginine translocation signal domain-containing protein n=1 Tax=Rhizobium phaseoli TaxID=396 RepID=A0A7K3UFU6_9HYPH|nr:twin-arginine translocation signal domain-containing protein [Rhizobium phaseoli]